jgi:1-deoxy-D-xylulose-5-phosphate reductoisomerase
MQAEPTQSAPRRLSILGATGSIGDSTLRVVEQHAGQFEFVALTAQKNSDKLIALAQKYRPQIVAIGQEDKAREVKSVLAPLGITVLAGAEGIAEAASAYADITMSAIVGAAGLLPTLKAIEHGRYVAIANKEALVCAGALVAHACRQYGATLLPVDSEHNAVFQVLANEHRTAVEKITLTASGGPLLTRPLHSFSTITPEEAVKHPRWEMGAKISIDSATMMNKGLELIEAHYLFDMPPAQLDVLIHPESIVHSLVHYADGSVLAQLGMPDMAIPIAYTLGWPNRLAVATPRLDLAHVGSLHFSAVEEARFPALALARAALLEGPAQMIALNAANEIAVGAFLARRIAFTAIAECVAHVLNCTPTTSITAVDDVIHADMLARTRAEEYL